MRDLRSQGGFANTWSAVDEYGRRAARFERGEDRLNPHVTGGQPFVNIRFLSTCLIILGKKGLSTIHRDYYFDY